MSDPIWMIGPPGNLRPLVCPEKDVNVSVTRYGGVHQNLSGARVMDITGHRQDITLEFRYLTDDEYRWLRAMHLRMLPGPHRLISPMTKNRLTPEAAMSKPAVGTRRGFTFGSGVVFPTLDYPTGLPTDYVGASGIWSNRATNSAGRWDEENKTTVLPGETITGSVYVKGDSSTPFSMNFGFDWFDRTEAQLSGSTIVSKSATNSWTRWTVTGTAPAGATMVHMFVYGANVSNSLTFGPAQVEAGAAATSWDFGGGSPQVLVDQITDISTRFGYHHATVTLLEA